MAAPFRFSFSRRLFLSVVSVFLLFVVCFVAYQYRREKAYKIELLHARLQDYNLRFGETFAGEDWADTLLVGGYLRRHPVPSLRLTLVLPDGTVAFDSGGEPSAHLRNHAGRKEIREALATGSGYDIRRTSETLHGDFFYSATWLPREGCIVRTALPYDVTLAESLSADRGYVWFTFALTVLLLFVFYRYTRKLGTNIAQLRRFAEQAERDEVAGEPHIAFPEGELGDISRHIVRLYARLRLSEEDKSRLKRQLTQNIAHELKTPVSSIRGYLETLVANPSLPEETRRQFVERCYAQGVRLSNLLHDISVLTRMDEAPRSFETEQVDVGRLLRGLRDDVALQVEERGDTFLLLVEEGLTVTGNSQLLYSLFRNLADNAIAYAGPGVTLTVRHTGEEGRFHRFSFADNGAGVPPEHLSHLFERFYRVDKGRSRKLGGTGLGLAIVKNAVLLHGGTISARIASTGGLEFLFSLPKGEG